MVDLIRVCTSCGHLVAFHWWCITCGNGCEACRGLCEHHKAVGGPGGVYARTVGCDD